MIAFPNVKINLGLRVLRKRDDGYHDLETLFVPYKGIHDRLEIIPADAWSETSAHIFDTYGSDGIAQGITDDGKLMITIAKQGGVEWDPLSDLCVKAYKILDEEFGLPAAKIYLEKTSPVGAGLGGGSADAASALGMLSELFALGLSDESLAARAARIGSDCPFFIYNRPMIGEGRGEILSPYELSDIDFGDGIAAPRYRLEVIIPEGISVSTAEAYRGIRPYEGGSLREVLARPVEEWKDCLVNDFEPTVFAAHPRLAEIKQSLYDRGAVYASMSGSGSALFAIWR